MKIFGLIAALVSTVAVAQLDPNTVPPCIKDCSVEAAGKAGCSSPLDVGCVCGDKKDAFTQAAIPCITSKCGADALGQAQGIQNELCTNGVKQ